LYSKDYYSSQYDDEDKEYQYEYDTAGYDSDHYITNNPNNFITSGSNDDYDGGYDEYDYDTYDSLNKFGSDFDTFGQFYDDRYDEAEQEYISDIIYYDEEQEDKKSKKSSKSKKSDMKHKKVKKDDKKKSKKDTKKHKDDGKKIKKISYKKSSYKTSS